MRRACGVRAATCVRATCVRRACARHACGAAYVRRAFGVRARVFGVRAYVRACGFKSVYSTYYVRNIKVMFSRNSLTIAVNYGAGSLHCILPGAGLIRCQFGIVHGR